MRYNFVPIVDPEFESLIPPLSEEEFAQLEQNILEEGECHDPLITWNRILLDGHNRWKIIQKYPGEVDYECTELILFSRNEAMAWMIRNQLGRRNLPAYERARLALRLKETIAAEAKANQGTRTDLCQKSDRSSIDTKKELAKVAGVSHDTIHKVDVIEQKAPEEVKEQLRRGEVSINKAYKDVRGTAHPEQKPTGQKTLKEQIAYHTNPDNVPKYVVADLVEELRALQDDYIRKYLRVLGAHRDLLRDGKQRDTAETVIRVMEEFDSQWGGVRYLFVDGINIGPFTNRDIVITWSDLAPCEAQ